MRTTIAPLVLVGLALSLIIVQMSGLAGVLGVNTAGDHQIDDRINSTASQQPNVEGSAPGQSPDAIQFMVSALDTFVSIATAVFLLPLEFNNYMPWYSAYPLGLGLQMLAIVGIAQIAGGPWR